jgi:hypothetical protein
MIAIHSLVRTETLPHFTQSPTVPKIKNNNVDKTYYVTIVKYILGGFAVGLISTITFLAPITLRQAVKDRTKNPTN